MRINYGTVTEQNTEDNRKLCLCEENVKFCSCALDCSVAHIVFQTMTISIQNSMSGITQYQTLQSFGKRQVENWKKKKSFFRVKSEQVKMMTKPQKKIKGALGKINQNQSRALLVSTHHSCQMYTKSVEPTVTYRIKKE